MPKKNANAVSPAFYLEESAPSLLPYTTQADRSHLRYRMVEKLGRPFKKGGEIRPKDMVAVIAPSSSEKQSVYPMIWGYEIKGIDHLIFNAKLESAPMSKVFSDDLKRRRCVVPASWFYVHKELRASNGEILWGDRYVVQPSGSDVTYLAGIYRIEEKDALRYPAFVLLTMPSKGDFSDISDKMPIILPSSAIDGWIAPDGDPSKVTASALTDLVADKTDPEEPEGGF